MFTNLAIVAGGLTLYESHRSHMIPGDFCFVGSGEGCTAIGWGMSRSPIRHPPFFGGKKGGIESSFPIVFPSFPMVSLVSPCWMIIILWYTLPTSPYNVRPPATIAKLVNITPISLWFMVLITIVTGAYKPTNITGGPHIVNVTWTPKMAISNKKAIFGTRFQVPCWIYWT